MGKTVFFTSSPKQTIHLTDTSLSVPKVCTWNQQDNTIKISVRLVFFGLDINFILISNLDSSMYNWKFNTVERRRRMGPFKLCQRNKPKTLCVSAYISIHVLLMPRLFRPWAYIQIYSNAMKGKETLHFPILSKTCFPADIWDLMATRRIFSFW